MRTRSKQLQIGLNGQHSRACEASSAWHAITADSSNTTVAWPDPWHAYQRKGSKLLQHLGDETTTSFCSIEGCDGFKVASTSPGAHRFCGPLCARDRCLKQRDRSRANEKRASNGVCQQGTICVRSEALSTHEKECLAIIHAVDKWCLYLQHKEFVIRTNLAQLSVYLDRGGALADGLDVPANLHHTQRSHKTHITPLVAYMRPWVRASQVRRTFGPGRPFAIGR